MSESIGKRYFSKVMGNIGSGALQIGTQSVLVRFLGPILYGQYIFIRTHFESLVTDLGLSNALFTRVSQNNRLYQNVSALFILVVSAITLLIVGYIGIVFVLGKSHWMWPEVSSAMVFLGFLLGLVTFLARTSVLMVDATGHARFVEVARLLRAGVCFITISLLGWFNLLTIEGGMSVLIVSQFLFIFVTICFGHRRMGSPKPDFELQSLRHFIVDIWPFARPILFYSCFTLFVPLFDGWYLQHFAGSKEQSFYGMAMQVSTALFLATGALTPIFHREVALSFAKRDRLSMDSLFSVYTRRIFAIAAIPCVFVSSHALTIEKLLGGGKLSGASAAIAIMALYPTIQGAGQLSVAFQYATNRTKLFTIVGFFRDGFGILLTIFFVGTEFMGIPCLRLGATGLSLKCLLAVATTTYVMHFSNCRYLNRSFRSHLLGELSILLIVGISALASSHLTPLFVSGAQSPQLILSLLLSGVFYSVFVVLWGALFPEVFGFSQLPFRFFWKKISGAH